MTSGESIRVQLGNNCWKRKEPIISDWKKQNHGRLESVTVIESCICESLILRALQGTFWKTGIQGTIVTGLISTVDLAPDLQTRADNLTNDNTLAIEIVIPVERN